MDRTGEWQMPAGEWWIPAEKPYTPETTRWYCMACEEITQLERNPLWDGKYEGLRSKMPEWFVRCAACQEKHWQLSEYGCPDCGWADADENTVEEYGDPQHVIWAAMEYGGNPREWEETHKCPMCETVFTFTNANF